jgi:hypothetical protein
LYVGRFDSPHGSTKSSTALPRDTSKTRSGAGTVAENAAIEKALTRYPSQRPICADFVLFVLRVNAAARELRDAESNNLARFQCQ